MSTKAIYYMKVIVLGVFLGMGVQFTIAWTEPTSTPPNGNVNGPVTLGAESQEKAGQLILNQALTIENGSFTYPHLYFNKNGGVQDLFTDGSSALYYDSNNSNNTQMIFRDKENKTYGRVYGSGNGAYFGLLDGDGHWSYLAAKDSYTQFRSNNTPIMTISGSGNVGIGTTAPNAKLDVIGNINSTGKVKGTNLCINNDCRASWPSGSGGTDSWTTSGSNVYRASGNVGIGASSPSDKLQVNGNAIQIRNYGDSYASFHHPGRYWFSAGLDTSNGAYTIANGNGFGRPLVTVKIDGKVGIGQTRPSQKLDVAGKVKATGLCINNDCRTSWPGGSSAGDNLGNHSATRDLNMNYRKITRVANPTQSSDVATKGYVDAASGGGGGITGGCMSSNKSGGSRNRWGHGCKRNGTMTSNCWVMSSSGYQCGRIGQHTDGVYYCVCVKN